jgi:hypothetical protein
VVTNSFASKTAEGLRQVSPNIIAARPAIENIAAALAAAAECVGRGHDRFAPLALPASWDESLAGVAAGVANWVSEGQAAR